MHVIVNNQVGFTTAPQYARSSEYSTDVAKMIGAPVFHVNGDDPESCVWVAKLAVEYRQAFQKDVVIDMVCYRRRGHNEGDDPSMTQPKMYDIIDTKRSVRKGYTEALIGRGDMSVEEAERVLKDYAQQLEHVFNEVRELEKRAAAPSESVETEQPVPTGLSTGVDRSVIERIADAHVDLPAGFTPHPRVRPVLEKRAKMAREGGIDWAFAELLALGSVCLDGRTVRLSGQDTRRGTFVQRHSVLIDRKTGAEYTPLNNIAPNQAKFMAYDSALSEFAALGFEYGYSVANPDALVLWEAQFGDFADGAQPVIDEFISSGEAKWGQRSDVVLLLPHGHEGQGPDHTSGRIERFLQLCAEGSMTVAQPSTPANYFHLLRRHALDGVHRPLVVFTPKSMLRLKAAVSPVQDFTSGRFASVLDDPMVIDRSAVRRVLLCSGKISYELHAARQQRGIDRYCDRAGRAALPGAPAAADHGAGPLPERHRGVLGAGGAGQPGHLAVLRAEPARADARTSEPACGGSPGAPWRPLLRGRPRSMTLSSASSSPPLSEVEPCTSPTVALRNSKTGAAASSSASSGWPPDSEHSSTNTRILRTPSSGWPPTWPGTTPDDPDDL